MFTDPRVMNAALADQNPEPKAPEGSLRRGLGELVKNAAASTMAWGVRHEPKLGFAARALEHAAWAVQEMGGVISNLDDRSMKTAAAATFAFGLPAIMASSVEATDQIIPAVANVGGVGGVTWISDGIIYNGAATTAEIELVYTPRQDMNVQTQHTINLTVAPGLQLALSELLTNPDYFNLDENTAGSLAMTVNGVPADNVTLQSLVSAIADDGSKYGMGFNGVDVADAVEAGEKVFLMGSTDGTKYRENTGVVFMEDGTTVRGKAYTGAGEPDGKVITKSGNELESNQMNNVFAPRNFDVPKQAGMLFEWEVINGEAIFYHTLADGPGTNYPGTSDPASMMAQTGGEHVVLIEMGNVKGANNADWGGEGAVAVPGDESAVVTANMYRRTDMPVSVCDEPQPGPCRIETFTVPAKGTAVFPNVLEDLFGVSVDYVAGVEFISDNPIIAYARAKATLVDEFGVPIGSAGNTVPGLSEADLLQPGFAYNFLGAYQGEVDGKILRSNLALLNSGVNDVNVPMGAFNAAGDPVGVEKAVVVPAGTVIQKNKILRFLGVDDDTARVQIRPDGPIYGTMFNANQFDDPSTIPPTPEPLPPQTWTDVQITAAEHLKPVIDSEGNYLVQIVANGSDNIRWLSASHDGNNDGDMFDTVDWEEDFNGSNSSSISVPTPYNGEWHNQSLERLITIDYLEDGNLKSLTYVLPVTVEDVMSQEYNWSTDPEWNSTPVNDWVFSNKDQIALWLTQGDPSCTLTPDDIDDNIQNIYGTANTNWNINDENNKVKVFPDGVDFGCTDEAGIDDFLEYMAPYLSGDEIQQPVPVIVGLDLDGDGIADNRDDDGNGILDHVIDVSCTWPLNGGTYEHQIIVEPANGSYAFNTNPLVIPSGMGLDEGSGLIGYNPPCSDSGQTFAPEFQVESTSGNSEWIQVQYRVND